MKARDLLKKGESGIVIFTDGIHFRRKPNGTGWTGRWRISVHRNVSKVIIYRRDRTTGTNQIFTADEAGLRGQLKARHTILLTNIQPAGVTDLPWTEFASGSRNPIQYIK